MSANKQIKEYIRILSGVRLDEEVKKRIIKNCALYGVMRKIKDGKFRIVAVKKNETADNA